MALAMMSIRLLFVWDLYSRNPKVPQTSGAKSNGTRAVNCVAAMIDRPRKPRMQPIVMAIENSFLLSDDTLSMRFTLNKRVYDAMFSRVAKVVSFASKLYQYRTFFRVIVLQIRCNGS